MKKGLAGESRGGARLLRGGFLDLVRPTYLIITPNIGQCNRKGLQQKGRREFIYCVLRKQALPWRPRLPMAGPPPFLSTCLDSLLFLAYVHEHLRLNHCKNCLPGDELDFQLHLLDNSLAVTVSPAMVSIRYGTQ